MVLYLRTTTDKYELPIAVADTAKELAEELGVTEGTVYTQISKKRNGWYKVDLEDDSE